MSFERKLQPEGKGELHIEDFLDSERKGLLDGMVETEENLNNLKQEDIENPKNDFIKEKVEAVKNFIAEHPYLRDIYEGIKKFGTPGVVGIGIVGVASRGALSVEDILAVLGLNMAIGAYVGFKTGPGERETERKWKEVMDRYSIEEKKKNLEQNEDEDDEETLN